MTQLSRLKPVLTTLLVSVSLAGYLQLFPARFSDFRAFYCSGQAVLSGRDPYREHPLHECEHALRSVLLSTLPGAITIPAPFPGPTLLVFALIARLPFGAAALLWTFCCLLAVAASIVLVARLTATPVYASAIVIGFPSFVVPLPLGQLSSLLLLAIVTCASMLQANRPRLAALAALTTLVDPHVGLAVCLGVFASVAGARVTITAGALVVGMMSIVAFGAAREWEYVHDVLPLHALVNVPEFSQFSTANLAYSGGLSAQASVLLGNVWYIGALVIGAYVGLRLRPRLGLAAVAFVPVAFAVFGGTHTHLQQLELATPAFLLITARAIGVRRYILVGATYLACIPWLIAAPFPYLYIATCVLAMSFARVMGTPKMSGVLSVLSFFIFAMLFVMIVRSDTPAALIATASTGNPLAEVSWSRFVHATFLPQQAWFLTAKLPTLIAFVILLSAFITTACRKQRGVPNNRILTNSVSRPAIV